MSDVLVLVPLAVIVALLVRIHCMTLVCVDMFYMDEKLLRLLPGEFDMICSPRYWLLWTTSHWMAWINRRRSA